MHRFRGQNLPLAVLLLIACVGDGVASSQKLQLHTARHAASDLEITGLVEGLQPGAVGYLTREQLRSLPQVAAHLDNNENFASGISIDIRGPLLETVATALGALPSADLLEAACDDRYRAHYTREFLTQHHPILALSINGLMPATFAGRTKRYDPGPYFVGYNHFVPAFRILAHDDYAQVPANIVRLNFANAAITFSTIAPSSNTKLVQQGYSIAKQNCLRCHSQGETGGQKSDYSWSDLTGIARNSPKVFDAYVRDPKKVSDDATMPPNPKYDDATIAALHAYFSDFTAKDPAR